jgi:hypothetical protein
MDAAMNVKQVMKDSRKSYNENFDQLEKKDKLNVSELPSINLDLMLSDFNWQASGDASALEARLICELQALEKVI